MAGLVFPSQQPACPSGNEFAEFVLSDLGDIFQPHQLVVPLLIISMSSTCFTFLPFLALDDKDGEYFVCFHVRWLSISLLRIWTINILCLDIYVWAL